MPSAALRMPDAMGDAQEAAALLPLTLQNSYRARYRAMRPDWRSSGDQLEALVRGYVTPDSRVLDLGCGRGGGGGAFWRGLQLAAGPGPAPASPSAHPAPGRPVPRWAGQDPP